MSRALSILLMLSSLAPASPLLAQQAPGPAARPPKAPTKGEAARLYPWARRSSGYAPLSARIPPPEGFSRVPAARGSFTYWLRHLPLLPPRTPVRSYQGRVILPADHKSLAAVVDLDLSKRDRQQCADTIMRLRGEFHHARGRPGSTRFRWAGGKRFGYGDWRRGLRPVRQGRRWTFQSKARPGRGYANFRRYLEYMFTWTGTLHLAGEPRVSPKEILPGDFFIQGGSPGHTVVVLDMARGPQGKIRLLVGQGFMPAQDLHLMRAANGNPWFDWDPPWARAVMVTPFWRPFTKADLRRFRY